MKITDHPLPEDANIRVIELPDCEIDETEEIAANRWLHIFRNAEKRTMVFFYFLAAITGMLCVQLIWQVAILTLPR